jgi:hypothetical protein
MVATFFFNFCTLLETRFNIMFDELTDCFAAFSGR